MTPPAQPHLDAARRRPLRIAYLVRCYPRFSQTFIVNEILELERQGLDLRILALRRPDDGLFHEAVSRVRAKAEYLPETLFGLLRKSRQAWLPLLRGEPGALVRAARTVMHYSGAHWLDLARGLALLRWTGKHHIDHVHVHFGTDEATTALLANLFGGLSYSLTLHAFDIFRRDVNPRLLASKINHARFAVTVSEFNARYLRRLPGVDPARIRLNYNGIELDRFAPAAPARVPGLIFSVGRLIEKKGFIHLIRAIGHLRDRGLNTAADGCAAPLRCRIAGEGREEKVLRAEIGRLNLGEYVELIGPLKQDAVRALMQSAACFVLPCVAARDGNIDALPTVLLEALACGCPSVSTELSGIPEIIQNRTSGLLAPAGDDRALASAIATVLTDRAIADRLSVGARRRAEECFDIRKNVAVLHGWLRATAGAKGALAPREAGNAAQVRPELSTGAK